MIANLDEYKFEWVNIVYGDYYSPDEKARRVEKIQDAYRQNVGEEPPPLKIVGKQTIYWGTGGRTWIYVEIDE